MLGTATLIIAISAFATLLPTVSMARAALRVRRRACSIMIRASAIRSCVTVCSDTRLPKATRLDARRHILSSVRIGKPDQTHAMVNPARSQAALCDLETAPFSKQQNVAGRHADILEHDLRGAIRHAIESENGNRSQNLNAWRVHRYQNHRLLAVPVRVVRIRLAHEYANLAARIGRVGRIPLTAIDNVVIAIAHKSSSRCSWRRSTLPTVLSSQNRGADFTREQRL